jgi:aspartyl protease family protein
MSDGRGPWDLPPKPKPARTGEVWRLLLWLGVIAGGGVGVLWLAKLFPGRITGADWYYPINGLGFLALVASGILVSRRLRLGQIARYLGLWAGAAAMLLVGYTFRDDFADIGQRLRSELVPGYATPTAHGAVALSQSQGGAYEVVGAVNDQPVRFVVDTGASDVVLSPADARRIGIDVGALDFTRPYETANGAGHGARVIVDTLAIGPIRMRNVPVSINQAEMSVSLLGMSFLRRLDSFEFKRGQLILKAPKA